MNKQFRSSRQFAMILVALASLLLSACGAFIPTQAPVTLTFGFPRADAEYYQALLPNFAAKYPNITVTLKPYEDGPQGMTDVVIIPWSLTPNTTEMQSNMLPLDSYIVQEKDFQSEDFYPGVMEAFRINGEQMAVPSGMDPWVMYYNKDLFDYYHVAYPQAGWTWTDFLALAQSIRHPEDNVYGYASMDTNYTDSVLFLYQHGGALGDASGNPTLNTLENIEAVEWYTGLYRGYQVAPTSLQAQNEFNASYGGTVFGMLNGKIGMFMGNLSIRGGKVSFPSPWKFNWGMVPLPRDAHAFTGAFFEGIGIAKQSANPDAGWKWVSYLSRQPHNRLLPARVSLATSPEYAQLVGDTVAQAGRDAMADAIIVSNQNIGMYAGFIDIYFETINKLVNNDTIVREELDKAQILAEQRAP